VLDHRLRKLHVLRAERQLVARAAHEEHAVLATIDREWQRNHRANRNLDAFDPPHGAHPFVQRVRVEILDENGLTGFERRLELGIPVELHGELIQLRIFVRGHHGRHLVARTREHDAAVRHTERARGASHQQVVEFGH
jgi:hypothetical protein